MGFRGGVPASAFGTGLGSMGMAGVPGEWHAADLGFAGGGVVSTAGVCVWTPIWVLEACTIDAVCVGCTVVAVGSSVTPGIYAAAAADGRPGALLGALPAIATTGAAGFKSSGAGGPVSLGDPGLYWLGLLVLGGAPNLRIRTTAPALPSLQGGSAALVLDAAFTKAGAGAGAIDFTVDASGYVRSGLAALPNPAGNYTADPTTGIAHCTAPWWAAFHVAARL